MSDDLMVILLKMIL